MNPLATTPYIACRWAALLLCAAPVLAGAQPAVDDPCAQSAERETELRRRPGADAGSEQSAACDPLRMPAPVHPTWPAPVATPDRWRLVEQLGRPVDLLDPYAPSNPLKGDRPIFGDDGFLSVAATSNTLLEPRLIPGTERLADARADAVRTATAQQTFLSQTLTVDTVIYEGDTVFRPPDWQWRFTPAINYSATLSGSANASKGSIAVQGLSYERHLRDVSEHYDFDSVRVGIQPIISDFRGFLLSDQPLAARLFGTRDDNVFQYNLALIARLPKNSVRLNDVSHGLPNDQVVFANLYWQDLFKPGLTSEFVFAYNRNHAKAPQVLPDGDGLPGAPVEARRAYDVAYAGYALDGHVGRLNATAAAYGLVGRDRRDLFIDRPTQVRALFAAGELSMDFDWRRPRLSLLHASGDADPHARVEGGFDTLSSGATFAGSDSSFFFHQRLALADGVFDLKSRDGLLPSLRPAGNSLESNFSNPGLDVLGLGLDLSLTPRWTVSVDANELLFDKTAVLEALLGQSGLSRRIGAEFAIDAIWRPLATQNLILRLSGSQLLAGPAYRALYGGSNPYSLFALLILNY